MNRELNPLKSLQATLAFDPRDWSVNKRDAWVYGIILGWDDSSLKELQEKHSWTNETVLQLKRLRQEFESIENIK